MWRFYALALRGAADASARPQTFTRFVPEAGAGDRHPAGRWRLSVGHVDRPLDRPVAAWEPQCAHRSDLDRARFAVSLDRPAAPDDARRRLRRLAPDRRRAALAQSLRSPP